MPLYLFPAKHIFRSASPLDTYELERKPHAWSLIQMAVKIGTFMQPKSALSARLTQGALKLGSIYPPVRDYVQQLKFKPKPRFFQGFFAAGEAASALVPAGQLLPQPMVYPTLLSALQAGKLDEVVGAAAGRAPSLQPGDIEFLPVITEPG